MKFSNKILTSTILAASLALPATSFATNGYFAHGYGTKSKGLVGAGVALSQDAMAAATNPAGMVFVGNRMDVGAAIFSPSPRSYTTNTLAANPFNVNSDDTTVESGSDFFLIPHFGRNWMLDDSSSIGVSVYGNGGMNTDYGSSNTAGGFGTFNGGAAGGKSNAGVNLMQLFIATTYARKMSDTASWGASLIVAHQRFEATGLAAFGGVSTDPTKLTDNGEDAGNGAGIKLGVQGEVGAGLTLAASYQSEIGMSKFSDYKGLFANGGEFDIPSTYTVGLAYKVSPKSTLVFDVQQINYSDIDAVGNPFSQLFNCPGAGGADAEACLGGSRGVGFGWDDMTIYKLGYQWETADTTWRVGYSQGEQPIDDTEVQFNILAPAVIEKHLTFGFTKAMDANSELNFAAMYALENSQKGNPFGTQEVELEMSQYEFELSYGKRF